MAPGLCENSFYVFPWSWFALDEWDSLSDDEKAKYDGDLILLR